LLVEEDGIIEDNQYLIKKLKDAGHPDCEIKIIPKRDHMSMILKMKNADDPALKKSFNLLLIRSINSNGSFIVYDNLFLNFLE
jgi:hypothetical protein